MRYAVCLEDKHKSKILAAAGEYDLIVVDADGFTAAEIRSLKSKGAKVLTYLNIGAIENSRSYYPAAKRSGLLLGKYDNWPGEYWVAAQKEEWKEVILGLATVMHAKGVDGFWVDNLDIMYTAEEEYKWGKTELAALYTNLQNILAGLHAEGYVMINGGDVFVSRSEHHQVLELTQALLILHVFFFRFHFHKIKIIAKVMIFHELGVILPHKMLSR